ncbi:hypothetical protein QOL99_14385 [Deinococcus sp. MIMF12]|uniref:Uncharacterized protein n=1 Tax=Deinococcus rhizophilus TaxID=3049544 RepID=A0ABT7JJT5_9DEIO|nr:hypothetical protein [Deinococcus rhizophilus]MDL2345327.1 hypothetical protein [Deinococcus rhizophilus]
MDFPDLIAREGFPPGVTVERLPDPHGGVFRVRTVDGARGLDLLLTGEAVEMYGEGPTLALVLRQLRLAAEAGLPGQDAAGGYERQVFVGD